MKLDLSVVEMTGSEIALCQPKACVPVERVTAKRFSKFYHRMVILVSIVKSKTTDKVEALCGVLISGLSTLAGTLMWHERLARVSAD